MSSFQRTRSDGAPDAGLILVALIVGAATLASVWPHHDVALGIAQAVAGTTACLSLAGWRSRPLAVALFTTAVAVFSPMAVAPTILAVVNAAIRCRLRTYVLLSVYVIALAAIHAILYRHHSAPLTNLIAAVPAVVVGLVARARRTRADIEEQQRVEQARAAERRQIAREMHDVLAHRISMVSVHAGALEYHPDAPPEDVAKAAGVIRSSAHAALDELREVISLLRNSTDRGDDEDEALPRPQPTLDDLPHLVEESRAPGTTVRFAIRLNQAAEVPAATRRTIYRIVQEGLTNARKHAPASAVDIEITDESPGVVTVSVTNDPSAGNVGDQIPARPTAPPGSGTGLIGLAERVALAGGRLEHGPTHGGGYMLKATLPT
jgi:signal transduction histidine kinase